MASIDLCGRRIEMLVDSGASVNLINVAAYESLKRKPILERTKTMIFGYNASAALPTLGQFTTQIQHKSNTIQATFIVVNSSSKNILSFSTSEALGIIKIVNEVSPAREYPQLFTGKIGKLVDFQASFHIDKTVRPTIQPYPG